MKKMIVVLASASALMTGMVSCKKEEMAKAAITQTETVNLKTNESYTFVLPKNLRDDPYEITSQAQHHRISEIGVNTAGERVFQYTPAEGYVGADQVILSNDEEREGHEMHPAGPKPAGAPRKQHPKGDCKGGEEDHYIITINFTIENNVTEPLNGLSQGISSKIK